MLRLKVLRSAQVRLALRITRQISSVTPVQAKIEPYGEYEGVYFLTLSRPEAKNSLGHQLMQQLREQLDTFTDKQARCLLIRSAVDKTFCAGADLKVTLVKVSLPSTPWPLPLDTCARLQERAAMSPEEGGKFVKMLRATFSAIAVQAELYVTSKDPV